MVVAADDVLVVSCAHAITSNDDGPTLLSGAMPTHTQTPTTWHNHSNALDNNSRMGEGVVACTHIER